MVVHLTEEGKKEQGHVHTQLLKLALGALTKFLTGQSKPLGT